MPLRNQHSVTFRPRGVTDSIDGSNAVPGSMGSSADLVLSMHTAGTWVPRPAAYKLIDFHSFIPPIAGEWLMEIGSRIYGFVASGRFPGHSEPFCYDFSTGGFVPISGVTKGNTPKSLPETGDWIPCTSVQVGGWILFSHAGFELPNAFGWIDQTGFTGTAQGDTGYTQIPSLWGTAIWGVDDWTGSNPVGGPFIANLKKNGLPYNVDIAGWRPGQTITDSAGVIPPGTVIKDFDADNGLWIELSNSTTAPIIQDTFTVAGGTREKPLWNAGNTAGNALPGVARAISLFNGRAEYAVKNAVNFSDAGDPLVKGATGVVIIQNGIDITALAPQPFNNATQIGGIITNLVIFQGDSGIWQISGDQSTNNLALNFVSPLGTLAPLTIQTTPEGLRFVAPDGARMLQLDGTLSPPLSAHGEGVALPFINAAYPSRMCAAYNEDVYRVSVTTYPAIDGSPIGLGPIEDQEWWYHLKLGAWSGPHSFPAKLIVASDRPATNHGFVMFPLDGSPAVPSKPLPELWFSNTRQLIDSRYDENGRQLDWIYRTSLLPDTETMFQNMAVETLLAIALAPIANNTLNSSIWGTAIWGGATWGQLDTANPGIWGIAIWGQDYWGVAGNTGQVATITARNELGEILDQVTLDGFQPPTDATQLPYAAPGVWGVAVWGGSLWGSQSGGAVFAQRRVEWAVPLNFKQMTVEVTGLSGPNVAIGNLRLRYQQLGYQVADPLYVIRQNPRVGAGQTPASISP